MDDIWGVLGKLAIMITLWKEIPTVLKELQELKSDFPKIKKAFKRLLKRIK